MSVSEEMLKLKGSLGGVEEYKKGELILGSEVSEVS
jgi:hypothetical protein